jgi:myo-inositol-1(or 4)-monophosphatase
VTGDAALLDLCRAAAAAVRRAVARLDATALRGRTDRPGQYGLDLAADDAALAVLAAEGVRVVSEESGVSGPDAADVTLVLDPVDGSTNCARGISYWATSIAALDGEGLRVGYVVNHANGVETTACRGGGAWRDGARVAPSAVDRVDAAVVAFAGFPHRRLPWKQFRALGCASLTLCDVAAGGLDAYVDTGAFHAPWDYLAALLVCREAGAVVADARGAELVTADPDARRHVLAAATADLLEAVRPAALPS